MSADIVFSAVQRATVRQDRRFGTGRNPLLGRLVNRRPIDARALRCASLPPDPLTSLQSWNKPSPSAIYWYDLLIVPSTRSSRVVVTGAGGSSSLAVHSLEHRRWRQPPRTAHGAYGPSLISFPMNVLVSSFNVLACHERPDGRTTD